MIRAALIRRIRRFGRDTEGAALVEFAVVALLFFMAFFSVIDFGRLAYTYLGSQSAMRLAVREAVVRPPACAGVPDRLGRGTDLSRRFGTSCNAGPGICEAVPTVTCRGAASNATAAAVYNRIAGLLPASTAVDSLQFTYTQDTELGYLGGPYVPIVTVELIDRARQAKSPIRYDFLVPFLNFTHIDVPFFSSSLPGEDLNTGDRG